MSAKKRRNSIYVIYEGYSEEYFLEHLEKHSEVRLNRKFCGGGSSNEIVIKGIIYSDRDVNVYVFFDEDFESKPNQKISDETLEKLAKMWKLDKDALMDCPYKHLQSKNKNMRNPILVVSCPQSMEGILLRLLDSSKKDELKGKTTKELKKTIDSLLDNIKLIDDDKRQIQEYMEKIDKYSEEKKQLKQSDANYRERNEYLKSKIKDYERKINKVTFMRFLDEKLPLSAIIAGRDAVPAIDILLKAFGF